ncbi:MAG: hypothetical protein JO316_02755 [Abitibacteriaceae bacterium]|nr:hypothetical protein [Abditibacteriaceae bacterium]MBV9864249.1 hypothetical protein [Abditibacteriaceae bacterium]
MKSRSASGCLVGVIALLGLAAFLFWRARTPPQVGENFSQLPPATQQQRRTEAKQFLDQVHGIQESARRKEHRTFTLEVSEAVLNTLLQDNLHTDKFQVRDLRAGLEPNQLTLQGHVIYNQFDAIATLTGNVTVADGKLVYQADSLKIGGMKAPNQWKDKTERVVTQQLNGLLKNAPGRIEHVTVAQQKLIIEGVID